MRIRYWLITMFSVAINGFQHTALQKFFIKPTAVVQSNEDARISASDMSEMRVK